MSKAIERLFRFIEMVGITALIKAVIVPTYPIFGLLLAGLLIALATLYLVEPAYDYCRAALVADAKSKKTVIVAGVVTALLFTIIQVVWLNPLVDVASDLIKATISTPSRPTLPTK